MQIARVRILENTTHSIFYIDKLPDALKYFGGFNIILTVVLYFFKVLSV